MHGGLDPGGELSINCPAQTMIGIHFLQEKEKLNIKYSIRVNITQKSCLKELEAENEGEEVFISLVSPDLLRSE